MSSSRHKTIYDAGWQRRIFFIVGALVAATMLSLAVGSSSARADGGFGDGGGGDYDGEGNGGCTVVGWEFVKSLNSIYRDSTSDGDLCGSPGGSITSAVRSQGAAGCADNADLTIAVWYLRDKGQTSAGRGSWATTNGGGDDISIQTRAHLTSVINNTPDAELVNGDYSARWVRQQAISAINAANYNTIVCVWKYDPADVTSYRCGDLADWGAYVPKAGVTANTAMPGIPQARQSCYLHCPVAGDPDLRPSMGNALVPASNSTDQLRGAYCFARSEAQDITRVTDTAKGLDWAPFYWTTSVANGGPHPGPTKFEPQVENKRTPYGDLIASRYGSCADGAQSDCGLREPTQAEIDAAVAATANAGSHAKVDLTSTNKQALAEGGVMNMTERSINYPTDLTHRDVDRCSRARSFIFTYTSSAAKGGTWGAWNRACDSTNPSDPGPWVNKASFTASIKAALVTQTPEVTGFYQALNVHCNAEGYKDARIGGSEIANFDTDKNYSGAAASGQRLASGQPLPKWGFGASNARGTDQDGFFDKQCAYEGQVKTNATSPVSASMFRDNVLRPLDVTLYAPKGTTNGVVFNDGSDAIRTILSRWDGSTPQPNGVSSRGALRTYTADGTSIFTSSNTAAPVLKQWSSSGTGGNRNWSVLSGQHSMFQFAGTWASDKSKPLVYTVKWIYAPRVTSTIPVQNIGFGKNSAPTGNVLDVWSKVDGQVMGKNDGSLSAPMFKKVAANTGSSVTENKLDGVLLEGTDGGVNAAGEWTYSPNDFSKYNFVLKFVRATTE